MVSVFIGTSVDGFIARPNGALDFLPPGGGEPHGYDEFFASIDTLVIGRKTFETVLAFPEWPYGDKRVVVLSGRPLDFSAVRRGVVEQMSGAPVEIVTRLAASQDRKSTRLNSSHQIISYAVFCLKKKKDGYSWADTLFVLAYKDATNIGYGQIM